MSIYQEVMSAEHVGKAWSFFVNPEHCANPSHYENFIRFDWSTDHKQGMGVTHVFIDEEKDLIAGYVTLRASSLIMDSGEGYKLGYPALEIAELAVDKRYEGIGLGTDMVKFSISEAVELNAERVGFQYVILCADNAAVKFYSNSRLKFKSIRQFQEIPREHRNSECEPMMLKIAEY